MRAASPAPSAAPTVTASHATKRGVGGVAAAAATPRPSPAAAPTATPADAADAAAADAAAAAVGDAVEGDAGGRGTTAAAGPRRSSA